MEEVKRKFLALRTKEIETRPEEPDAWARGGGVTNSDVRNAGRVGERVGGSF